MAVNWVYFYAAEVNAPHGSRGGNTSGIWEHVVVQGQEPEHLVAFADVIAHLAGVYDTTPDKVHMQYFRSLPTKAT